MDRAADYQPLLKTLDQKDCEEECVKRSSSRSSSRFHTLLALLAGVLLYPTIGLLLRPIHGPTNLLHAKDPSLAVSQCESTDLLPIQAPRKNVWKNLSVKEATEIRAWLWSPERDLNLTKSALAVDSDNYIYLIEAFVPPKAATLAYLNGSSYAPDKYAHAIINHGSSERIVDYLIGPLPLSAQTQITPLTSIYHEPVIPYNAHGFGPNSTTMGNLIASTFAPLSDLTMDLFGGVAKGLANDTLIGAGTAPLSYDGSWRRMWVGLKLNVPGHYLFPVDMYTYYEMSGTDSSKWHVIKMVYNSQVFNSTHEFREAWESGTLKRSKTPLLNDTSGWATRTRMNRGGNRDLDDRAGPRSVSFDGLRFRVDREEQYITWMGFSFYLGFERDMGLNLWDINFKGERIIYEISPQEAMAQYSGTDPHQATTVFLDRAFGMGDSVKELMVGYDCPVEAVYLPASIHTASGSTTRVNAICIFEKDSTKPLSRHTGWLKDEMGAIKGYELTVRSVSTVGNYDYIFDYTFQLDGTIEIRVSASGYLQGGVWDETQRPYGHQLRDTTMGSLHDHVINYKVDFDIAGTKNSLIAAMLEIEEVEQPWADEDWGKTFKQQKVVRRQIASENESKLEYPRNMEGMYVITNEEEQNTWGNSRGYAIHPGASNIHLTNLDCKRTQDNVNWAKHHLSLVVWLNLGTHHIPRAEDSPQTLTNVATSSVLLTPYNFHDYDVAMDVMNAVLLNAPRPGEKWQVDENNVKQTYCAPRKLPDFTYTGLLSFQEDGSPASATDIVEQRKLAESWHGLHAEI
ncbi:uncharacterized protein IL334_005785 [Kwoniella shivajii]|uniref:Amine oxidase n=1 Tax=Kwoniella shivajii TaxID=564305 RepID=A0ABZ1D4I1_9TREE|nr:hypothetical protein IL334_005785 [Kwoniella shivajii]